EEAGPEPEQIGDDPNLRDAGIDSLRQMFPVEKWRAAGVRGAAFVTLASSPTLGTRIAVFPSVVAAAAAQPAR
ncbi:hypothetical protein, partial [Streptomyces sp. GbtcB7]|uniref:hypothetical protein n=1 Tax=Streptomyces sp. GbtcB7 TaxID=2824752 RepID=UPI0020C695B2